jgi:hypothetical protein
LTCGIESNKTKCWWHLSLLELLNESGDEMALSREGVPYYRDSDVIIDVFNIEWQ